MKTGNGRPPFDSDAEETNSATDATDGPLAGAIMEVLASRK
jgi:hypothetical protein